MKRSNRKILALVLTVLMLVQAMPTALIGSAFADGEYTGEYNSPGY